MSFGGTALSERRGVVFAVIVDNVVPAHWSLISRNHRQLKQEGAPALTPHIYIPIPAPLPAG